MMWPKVIEKDGEVFSFSAEKPGWLLYENENAFVLVGKQEAFRLAFEATLDEPDTA